MKRAIIVGASSGIGMALARELAGHGYEVGLCARRLDKLEELAASLPTRSFVRQLDVSRPEEAMARLGELLEDMESVELVVANAGVGFYNKKLVWQREKDTIDVNVVGFAATVNASWRYFAERGGGHIVGVSSVAAVRGASLVSAYNASKAFMSSYLEGLHIQSAKLGANITVTDVRPGFVDTPMTEGQKGMFWVAPAPVAARQIYRAIERKRRLVFVTRRWRLAAWVLSMLPDFIYRKLG